MDDMTEPGTWGNNAPAAWRDDFTGKQLPDPEAVDDLSKFVMRQIRLAETEPVVDMVPKLYGQPGGTMAHRYAGNVRRDMVAFRRVVAAYCKNVDALQHERVAGNEENEAYFNLVRYGLRLAVLGLANRWSDHPDFRDEWRLE